MPRVNDVINAIRSKFEGFDSIGLDDIRKIWDDENWDAEDDDLTPIIHKGVEYTSTAHVRFVRNMLAAGYEPYLYHGRFFYHGPAINTSRWNGPTERDVYDATRVKLQADSMGLDMVLYPTEGDAMLKNAVEEDEDEPICPKCDDWCPGAQDGGDSCDRVV